MKNQEANKKTEGDNYEIGIFIAKHFWDDTTNENTTREETLNLNQTSLVAFFLLSFNTF